MMNELEFNQKVDQTLMAIEEAIEEVNENQDAEIDYDTVAGILTLEFEDGSRIIINRQSANSQLWVATKSGGYHFDYQEMRWIDNKNGQSLGELLSLNICQQAQMPLTFNLSSL